MVDRDEARTAAGGREVSGEQPQSARVGLLTVGHRRARPEEVRLGVEALVAQPGVVRTAARARPRELVERLGRVGRKPHGRADAPSQVGQDVELAPDEMFAIEEAKLPPLTPPSAASITPNGVPGRCPAHAPADVGRSSSADTIVQERPPNRGKANV